MQMIFTLHLLGTSEGTLMGLQLCEPYLTAGQTGLVCISSLHSAEGVYETNIKNTQQERERQCHEEEGRRNLAMQYAEGYHGKAREIGEEGRK
ncbi:uncharacterized protein LY79DRAFT_538308 [Colletotrichum navitas]|uniref:Uncharacterized protein n=1 Tax=Colletotrichum navitas TaxID=681940 RepID=A0AAD8QCK9_9PEZI|nr:uncharacterized protein LY79DRAFT_538308 [Colletotrichum navitas]KAK1598813.1 hypothetical protein LY79DRAFT_538308 [Colletotrichum navitas]